MLHFITPEVEFAVLEFLGLAKSNRFFIRLRETGFLGILEIGQDTFKLEELRRDCWHLTDILEPTVYQNERELKECFGKV